MFFESGLTSARSSSFLTKPKYIRQKSFGRFSVCAFQVLSNRQLPKSSTQSIFNQMIASRSSGGSAGAQFRTRFSLSENRTGPLLNRDPWVKTKSRYGEFICPVRR